MTAVFSDSNFEDEVIKSSIPVLVDFWASWCGPCKMLAPTIDELAEEYNSKIKIGKLNVDENPATADKYGIRSIPQLLLFDQGLNIEGITGVVPKEQIKSLLNSIIE